MILEFEMKEAVIKGYKDRRNYNDGWKKRILLDKTKEELYAIASKNKVKGGIRTPLKDNNGIEIDQEALIILGRYLAMWCEAVDLEKPGALNEKKYKLNLNRFRKGKYEKNKTNNSFRKNNKRLWIQNDFAKRRQRS